MNESKVILITGGARSGKSRLACQKALSYPRRVFLATAVATDPEMGDRIQRHRKERGSDFVTIEEPLYLAQAIRNAAKKADVILVDCLTFWLNNLLHDGGEQGRFVSPGPLGEVEEFLRVLEERPTTLILVTNEINMGVVPADGLTREFVDRQGRLNQEVARRADEVILLVAGLPQVLKTENEFARGVRG